MQDALEGYYAHPWAWDEIGFGGPAYPRAYTRLERGEPEPWEVEPRATTGMRRPMPFRTRPNPLTICIWSLSRAADALREVS